jgi:hypothetical protein
MLRKKYGVDLTDIDVDLAESEVTHVESAAEVAQSEGSSSTSTSTSTSKTTPISPLDRSRNIYEEDRKASQADATQHAELETVADPAQSKKEGENDVNPNSSGSGMTVPVLSCCPPDIAAMWIQSVWRGKQTRNRNKNKTPRGCITTNSNLLASAAGINLTATCEEEKRDNGSNSNHPAVVPHQDTAAAVAAAAGSAAGSAAVSIQRVWRGQSARRWVDLQEQRLWAKEVAAEAAAMDTSAACIQRLVGRLVGWLVGWLVG